MINYVPTKELYHHGILGQKWGVRRFQRPDGTLTNAGKKRFAEIRASKRLQKKTKKTAIKMLNKESRKARRSNMLINAELKALGKTGKGQKYGSKLEAKRELNNKKLSYTNSKVSDISQDRIKAGVDYAVVKRIYKLPYVAISFTGPKLRFAKLGRSYLLLT